MNLKLHLAAGVGKDSCCFDGDRRMSRYRGLFPFSAGFNSLWSINKEESTSQCFASQAEFSEK